MTFHAYCNTRDCIGSKICNHFSMFPCFRINDCLNHVLYRFSCDWVRNCDNMLSSNGSSTTFEDESFGSHNVLGIVFHATELTSFTHWAKYCIELFKKKDLKQKEKDKSNLPKVNHWFWIYVVAYVRLSSYRFVCYWEVSSLE